MVLNKARNSMRKFISSSYAGIVISISILFIFYIFYIPNFFTVNNIINVLLSAVTMGLVAVGQSMLIISGYLRKGMI